MAWFRLFRQLIASSKELLRFRSVVYQQWLVNRIIDVVCLALYQTLQRSLRHFLAHVACPCLEYSRDLLLENLGPERKFQDLIETLNHDLGILARDTA